MSTATITGPAQTLFFTKSWTPSPDVPVVAQVLFVHGFVEHIERYDHVFPKFIEQGIAVFGFDQRGFGRTAATTKSQGVTSWAQALGDISFFIHHASSLHPDVPLYLVGHSMGGGLVLAYSTRRPTLDPKAFEKVKGVIASSPLLRQTAEVRAPALLVKVGSLLGKVSASLTIKTVVKPADICRDPVVQEAYAHDPLCAPIGTYRGVSDMLLGGENLVTRDYKEWPLSLPLLIVHGESDKVTDCHSSEEFVNKVKTLGAQDATYRGFPGYYHEMHNEPGQDKWVEIAALTDWIKLKCKL